MTSVNRLFAMAAALLCALAATARAQVVLFNQPPNPAGGVLQSSWFFPDGSDYDQYVWDAFTLPSSQAINEIRWRGGYIYGASYGGHATDFTVAIYPSIAAGIEPDIVHPPLVSYHTNTNAGETAVGSAGGVMMYDYHFTLPSPFQAAAGVKYWIQIEASQNGIPDWGFSSATSGMDTSYFRRISAAGDAFYQIVSGAAAFTLMGSSAPTVTISASVTPAGTGSIQGAGSYPIGSLVTLSASPSAGYGFVNWTENGTQVSASSTYTFTASVNRTLVAHFTPAYTITTNSSPTFGGSTSGDGIYNSGATATVTATANAGYVFTGWTEFGTPVSSNASYSFIVTSARTLTANFNLPPGSAIFDFDNAPVHTSLPLDVTSGGVTAHLSATGAGYSIQAANTMGFTPAGFSGLCIYPNSIFAADLIIDFNRSAGAFSIMYSPQELGCDSSATMRATAYMNGAYVGTDTAVAPVPGTWPTGTLRFSSTQPFNRVVVHYDSRPPTCQDYGVIFLADNMTFTPAPCPADADGNGLIEPADIAVFVNTWFTSLQQGTLAGDFDGNGAVQPADIAAFVNAWFTALNTGAC